MKSCSPCGTPCGVLVACDVLHVRRLHPGRHFFTSLGDYIMTPEAAFNADWADDGRDASAIFTDWLSCTYS